MLVVHLSWNKGYYSVMFDLNAQVSIERLAELQSTFTGSLTDQFDLICSRIKGKDVWSPVADCHSIWAAKHYDLSRIQGLAGEMVSTMADLFR